MPAAVESGVLPGYDVTTWYGVFAPHGTPAPIVAKLNKVLMESLADEAVQKRLVAVGVIVKGSTPDEFGQFMAERIQALERRAREGGHHAAVTLL